MKLTLSQPMDIEKLRSLEVKLSIKEDVKNE